jgi:hypothetical protein
VAAAGGGSDNIADGDDKYRVHLKTFNNMKSL